MTLAWLAPLGLGALAALLVPLLLHLARRREQRVLRFAAMRWLPAGRAPRRRLRLQERGLLLLRLLLVALAALWLAQPLVRDAGRPLDWLAVAPGVDLAAAREAAQGFDRAVWLLPGLPGVDAGTSTLGTGTQGASRPAAGRRHDLAAGRQHDRARAEPGAGWTSLLQEFTARLPGEDTATVLVPGVVSLGEQVPMLSHAVAWREAPAPTRSGAAEPPPLLALRHADPDSAELHWLRAAIAAWEQHPQLRVRLDDAPATTPVPQEARAVLWVGPLPERAGLPRTPLLHVPTTHSRDATGSTAAPRDAPRPTTRSLSSPPGRGAGGEGPAPPIPFTETDAQPAPALATLALPHAPAHWRTIAAPLHPATMPAVYEPSFPHRLHATLFGPPSPTLVPVARLRELAVHPRAGTDGDPVLAPRGLRDLALSPLLGWLLLALFLVERWYATGRRLERNP